MYIILQELLLFFRYDVHEKEVGKIALEMGFEQVSLSSTIMPMVRVVPRGYTGKYKHSEMVIYLCTNSNLYPKWVQLSVWIKNFKLL